MLTWLRTNSGPLTDSYYNTYIYIYIHNYIYIYMYVCIYIYKYVESFSVSLLGPKRLVRSRFLSIRTKVDCLRPEGVHAHTVLYVASPLLSCGRVCHP